MAEQDKVNPNAVPPKVVPFAKVEPQKADAAADEPAAATVRLKPIKPVTPAATPAAPVAAPRPLTVKLRPVAAPGGADAPSPAAPGATQTVSQVELSATGPIKPIEPLPQSPPTPGGTPLTSAKKPASEAQTQAAKSKTSRIPLDAALQAAAKAPEEAPKTIRLKRPTDLATPAGGAQAAARKTSRIPDSAIPQSDATVTQKRTLKIRRPGAAAATPAADAADGATDDAAVAMTPIAPTHFAPAPKASAFTTFAVVCASAALIVLVLLTLCLGAHNIAPDAGGNALASIRGPELPWPGRISN